MIHYTIAMNLNFVTGSEKKLSMAKTNCILNPSALKDLHFKITLHLCVFASLRLCEKYIYINGLHIHL